MNKIITAVLVALVVATVTCNDIRVGSEHGRLVWNATYRARPALWRQSHNITGGFYRETINGITVIDGRKYKDGEAKIIEGGVGQKNVKIQLKSPTILRGYDFHVEIYTVSDDEYIALHPALMIKYIKA